ncbi:MAG: hypothetical protein ABIH09_02285 [Candidatus Omnitrophota bacterium]
MNRGIRAAVVVIVILSLCGNVFAGDYSSKDGSKVSGQDLGFGDYFSAKGVRAKGQDFTDGDYFSEQGVRAPDQGLGSGDYFSMKGERVKSGMDEGVNAPKEENPSNIIDKKGDMLVD